MAYFNNFNGPEGQRNALLTFCYVVFVRIIGLCVDFKPFLLTLSVLVRLGSDLQDVSSRSFKHVFMLGSRFERFSN